MYYYIAINNKVFVNGYTYFNCLGLGGSTTLLRTSGLSVLSIHHYSNYLPTILPQYGDAAFLGNYNTPFWAAYTRELCSLGAVLYSLSDCRLKTKIIEMNNDYVL
jgi:hypothetical protein